MFSKFQCQCTAHHQPSDSVEMDPEMAKMVFFSKENSANWVVLEKWHEYQLEGIRQQLGRSSGIYSKSTSRTMAGK